MTFHCNPWVVLAPFFVFAGLALVMFIPFMVCAIRGKHAKAEVYGGIGSLFGLWGLLCGGWGFIFAFPELCPVWAMLMIPLGATGAWIVGMHGLMKSRAFRS